MVIANRLNEKVPPWSPSFGEPDIEIRQSPLFVATQSLLPLVAGVCTIAEPGLWGHSLRVGKMASKVGEVLCLESDHLERLEVAGFLHDLGRVVTPLNSPTPDRHTLLGARAIGGIPYLNEIAPVLLFHHERWDGSGSPAGLAGEAIPLDARIIAVVDAFDRLISSAPGGDASRVTAALESLKESAGKCFDRDIVTAFRQACATLTVKTLFGRPELTLRP